MACKITACDDGYDVNTTLNKCKEKKVKTGPATTSTKRQVGASCTPTYSDNVDTAVWKQDGKDFVCTITKCLEDYKLDGEQCVIDTEALNAENTTTDQTQATDNTKAEPNKAATTAEQKSQPEKTTTNEKQAGTPCTPENPDNVDTAVWKQSGRRMTCTITKCATGYKQNGNQCIAQCGQNESLVNGKCVAKPATKNTTQAVTTNKTATNTKIDDYEECKVNIQSQYSFSYKNDSRYKEILAVNQERALTEYNAKLNEKNTTEKTGDCNGTAYTCHVGDANKDCVPEACWSLYKKGDLFIQRDSREAFIEEKTKEKCGG